MNFLKAVFLGLIQGLTEFFPVSSTGHLAIFEQLLHVRMDSGLLFDVLLHLGTLTAVVFAFRKDLIRLLIETGRIVKDLAANLKMLLKYAATQEEQHYNRILTTNYRRFAAMILVATVPTALMGFFLEGAATKALDKLLYPGIGLFITGIFLLVVDMVDAGSRIPKDVPMWQAFLIGVVQGISVFPGISRSGVTICSSVLCGLNRKLAVRFSFLLSVPAIIGALILELSRAAVRNTFHWSDFGYGILGGTVAGIVGYFCIRKMLLLVQKKKLRYFAFYCFAIGVLAVAGYFVTGEA